MKKWSGWVGVALACILALLSVMPSAPVSAAASHRQLAEHWAPEFHQDINYAYNWKADLLTNFNYDGDWNAANNWDNLLNYPLKSYVYYSVVETQTHYFIGYYGFHPRDDGPVAADDHPNDMEATLLVIKKDGTTYGKLQAMETFAHYLFYQYKNDANITKGQADIDGTVKFRNGKPLVYIQPNGLSNTVDNGNYGGGHGMYAYSNQGVTDAGIVYYYGGTASVVGSKPTGTWTQRVSYDLISLDALFDRRENTATYPSFDKAPWGWDMYYDDGGTGRGEFLSDPAHMVDTHMQGLGTFSHTYVSNRYATHIVTIQDVTSLHNGDATTASDVFVKFWVGGNLYADAKLWRRMDLASGNKANVFWGANAALDGDQYDSNYNTRHIIRPRNSQIKIEVLDHDNTGSDSLGYVTASPAPGTTKTWTNAATSNGRAKISAEVQATNN
ncbi:hypothetical protein MO973_24380 [Paenibacillus sp. TRM 82003]|nr:hypothetical protein [Paenibacillus sp. TRM 82003]MCI3923368.1 hypothetical protein [Paenibacillus sp. TRM 82003]